MTLKSIQEILKTKYELNEMPKYNDIEYKFKPIEDKGMTFLESKWKKIPITYSKINEKGYLLYINNRNTLALIGVTYYDKEMKSWRLAVHSYIKLEKDNKHYKVIGVYTKEELQGNGIAFAMYKSLIDYGFKLESDNEQYSGAKPLWITLSNSYNIEIYDENKKEVIIDKFDIKKHNINDIWSNDYSKFNIILRIK